MAASLAAFGPCAAWARGAQSGGAVAIVLFMVVAIYGVMLGSRKFERWAAANP